MNFGYEVPSAHAIDLGGTVLTLGILEMIANKLQENGEVYVRNCSKTQRTLVELWAELAKQSA
jgi:hypothetical protein